MILRHTKQHHVDFPFIYALAVLSVILLSNISGPFLQHNLAVLDFTKEENLLSEVFDKQAFEGVTIYGRSFVVYDVLSDSIVASKNENEILPLASITKIMMAITARLHHEKNTPIVIHQRSIEDGYDLGLKKDQVWKLDELLKYTLVFSSNDGAQAIADSFGGNLAFVKQMNIDAQALGLQLVFTDPAGRDENNNVGGLGSALSVAKLFSVARKNFPQLFDATTKPRSTVNSSTGRIIGIPNTNQNIEKLSGAEGSKTGYTDKAGGNLGVLVDISIGRPVVIVVLGSSKEARFSDVEILYTALRKSIGK